nr:hypothetical protein [Tanacetum cinerariifolium]
MSVNVNFDEISEMASKQFSLEPGLSNLNETGKSSNLSVSQVSEASKTDLEDLFQKFYDEYFDSSKIMKSSTTNVEPPQINTQSISINMIPNGDEASTSHNEFNERLEDAYFDANTSITAAEATKVIVEVPKLRKRRGVIIQDLKETTTIVIVQPKVQEKDKGKTTLIEEPKPLKRQVQIDVDEEVARQLKVELNVDINWNAVIKQVKKSERLTYAAAFILINGEPWLLQP